MQKDRLSAVYCGQVNGRYVTVRPGDSAAKPLDEAVLELQRALEGLQGSLEASIRRTDKVGHPRVCVWARKKAMDPWTFEWEGGADDRAAAAPSL
jgi:hypothetical protein